MKFKELKHFFLLIRCMKGFLVSKLCVCELIKWLRRLLIIRVKLLWTCLRWCDDLCGVSLKYGRNVIVIRIIFPFDILSKKSWLCYIFFRIKSADRTLWMFSKLSKTTTATYILMYIYIYIRTRDYHFEGIVFRDKL